MFVTKMILEKKSQVFAAIPSILVFSFHYQMVEKRENQIWYEAQSWIYEEKNELLKIFRHFRRNERTKEIRNIDLKTSPAS